MKRPPIQPAAQQHQAAIYVALYLLFFAAIALSHITLLRLPYFWDEGGYYIPAAWDFYRHHTLIPEFTNAHPPLPNVAIGVAWMVFGFHILVTRLLVCAFAAAGLLAVFTLARKLLGVPAAFATAFLTAVYPIWFAQSTLAQADIFAAAFTLWAFAVYLPGVATRAGKEIAQLAPRTFVIVAIFFSLAVLSKETAIVQPAALFLFELALLLRDRGQPQHLREHLRWLAALAFPVLPLLAWYVYHHHVTGFTFGNPEYLRYNATANFTVAHVLLSLKYRAMHLFWQRYIWVPIVIALACMVLAQRSGFARILPSRMLSAIALLIIANWIAFSVLGGALLTRYLLPMYPLIFLLCVAVWRSRTRHWPWLASLSAAALVPAIWLNPAHAFAPEDNLTYRDMIVVHQRAIDYLNAHYPAAHVLTAWPAASELVRPELGYTGHIFHVTSIDNFTRPEVTKGAERPGDFDTVLAFTTRYEPPGVLNELAYSTDRKRLAAYNGSRDLTPEEIAATLGGTVAWQTHIGGEWSAIIRFPRVYNSLLAPALLR